MAAPVIVASNSNTATTSINHGLPITPAVNDIILAIVQTSNQSITPVANNSLVGTPYTEIDAQASMATGTAATLGSVRMGVFWRRADGTETSAAVADSGDHQHVRVLIIRGCTTTGNPFDVETCGVQSTTSTSVSWQSAGFSYGANGSTLTTATNHCLVLGLVAHAVDLGTTQFTATEACAALENFDKYAEVSSTTGTGGGIGVFAGTKATAGTVVASSVNNFSVTLANTSAYAIMMLAMKPSAAYLAAPIFIGAGAQFNNVAATTAPLPPDHIADDILILVVHTSNQTAAAPSGYTEIDTQASMGTGTAVTAGSLRMSVFWKRDGGSESDPTIADSGDHQIGRIYGFRSSPTSGNPWDVETCGVQATASTAVSWQSAGFAYGSNGSTLTTTVDSCLVLGLIAHAFDSATAQSSGHTCAQLDEFQEWFNATESTFTSGTGGGVSCAMGLKLTAGAVVNSSTLNMSATLANASKYAMFIMALKPAGVSAVVADLDKTLGAATLSSASGNAVVANLSGTLGAALSASAGVVPVQANLSKTLGITTLVSAGTVVSPRIGDLNVTLGTATFTSAGAATVSANFSKTLGGLTSSATTALQVTGTLSKTLGVLTLVGQGGSPAILAALDKTLGVATCVSVSKAATASDVGAQLGPLTAASTGQAAIIADLTQTLGALVVNAIGGQPSFATADITLGDLLLYGQAGAAITFADLSLNLGTPVSLTSQFATGEATELFQSYDATSALQ